MSDQIREYCGIKLPKGVIFDGRHARIGPEIDKDVLGNAKNLMYHVNRLFDDIGDKIFLDTGFPVIVICEQPNPFETFHICLTPIGLISVYKDRLVFDDEAKDEG